MTAHSCAAEAFVAEALAAERSADTCLSSRQAAADGEGPTGAAGRQESCVLGEGEVRRAARDASPPSPFASLSGKEVAQRGQWHGVARPGRADREGRSCVRRRRERRGRRAEHDPRGGRAEDGTVQLRHRPARARMPRARPPGGPPRAARPRRDSCAAQVLTLAEHSATEQELQELPSYACLLNELLARVELPEPEGWVPPYAAPCTRPARVDARTRPPSSAARADRIGARSAAHTPFGRCAPVSAGRCRGAGRSCSR